MVGQVGDLLELLTCSRRPDLTVRAEIRTWKETGGALGSRPAEVHRRIWVAEGRRRMENDFVVDDQLAAKVAAVVGANWWQLVPGEGVTVGTGAPGPVPVSGSEDIDALLENLGWYDLDVEDTGSHVGRACIHARATPRPPVAWSWSPRLLAGDEHEVWVDAERGLVLRLESRLSGKAVALTETVTLSFDEVFPAELFRPPPGEVTRTADERLAATSVSLAEAVARAPFAVLLPGRTPTGACLGTVFFGRRGADRVPSVILTYDLHHGRSMVIHEAAVADPFGDLTGGERLERDGLAMTLWEPSGARSQRLLWVERAGTHALLSLSAELGRDDLVAIGGSLQPAVAAGADGGAEP